MTDDRTAHDREGDAAWDYCGPCSLCMGDHPCRRGRADRVSRPPSRRRWAYTITRPDYLLVYLVAAAELAVAVLSFGATRLTDWAALRLIVTTLVVLHGASGILDIVYMGTDGGERHDDRQHRAAVHGGRGVPRRVAGSPPSPDVGHQPVVHLLRVLAVSGQVPASAPSPRRGCGGRAPQGRRSTISRPQYEPSASGTPIIRMTLPKYIGCRTKPYKPVDDHLLVRLDLDIGGGIAVLDRHDHRDGEPDRDQHVSRSPRRPRAPSTSRSESPTR